MATRLGNLLRLGVPLGARYIDYVQSLGLTSIYRYNETATESPLVLRNWANTGTYPGAELLVDGDMEAAGTSAWTAQDATLSKETTDPVSGVRYMRVTATVQAGAQFPQCNQTILTVGKRYRVTGYTKSDGAMIPRVSSGGTIKWSGTTSTSWQFFDVEFVVAVHGIIGFFFTASDPVGSEFCEWDDISVTEADPLNGDNSGATIGQNGQLGSNEAYLFDGNDDYIQIANNAALADLTTQRWAFLCNPTSLGEVDFGALYTYGGLGAAGDSAFSLVDTNRIRAVFKNDANVSFSWITVNNVVDLNSWVLLFMDYDDANELGSGRKARIFKGINGTLTQLALGTDDTLTGVAGGTLSDLYLGNNSVTNRTFDGLFDETLVGAGLWTTQEMQNLINLTGV
jgi:hypothetical protein